MLLRKLVVVGLVGFVSFAANIATAEDAVGPSAGYVGVDGVNFADPTDAFPDRFQLNISPGREGRFANLTPAETQRGRTRDGSRSYELSLVASSRSGLDVSFAQRGGVGFNDEGEIDRQTRGSELRLGRGLRNMPRDEPSAAPKWYLFAASEDEALIWRPGMRSEFGSTASGFALQDRVEIGDIQAGITYEANGWQASLAYVEREVSTRSGTQTYTQDENFAGVTLTMRH
jgi:hypothetical protein